MDYLKKVIIELDIDNISFEAHIYPTGEYVFFGPIWRAGGVPELARGKLSYGFAMPGLLKSITDLIRFKLKEKAAKT